LEQGSVVPISTAANIRETDYEIVSDRCAFAAADYFSFAVAQNELAAGVGGRAVVGGAVGRPVGAAAVVCTAVGDIYLVNRPRFHSYETERNHQSDLYGRELLKGFVPHRSGLTYYEVP
jgi:hypothetical protein